MAPIFVDGGRRARKKNTPYNETPTDWNSKMFENITRSVAAVLQIVKSHREHKAEMKMIKEDGDMMLKMIDDAFDNLRK